ncbi:MAG: hypothetical protein ACRCWC_05345, partial [Plesiomonas shigelloides]
MNPEQLKAALRSAGYVVASEGGGGYGSEPGDPFIPGPTTYYYYGPRGRASAAEAAAAIGVPEATLTSMESRMVATPEESASLYPSRGGGFFSHLAGLVTSPSFALAASVVAPSILAAEAAGAAAAAAPAANTGAGLIDASLGQAYADLGVGAGAPAAGAAPSVVTQPIATSPLPVFTEPGMAAANMLAADAAGLAVPANAFVPSATTGAIPAYSSGLTSSGLTNFIDPFNPPLSSYTSPFAPPTAGVGGVALSPEALAAYDASVGLTAGTGAGVGAAGAGANALAGYGGAGDVLNSVTGAITNAPGTIPNYSTGLVGYGGGGDFLDPVTG